MAWQLQNAGRTKISRKVNRVWKTHSILSHSIMNNELVKYIDLYITCTYIFYTYIKQSNYIASSDLFLILTTNHSLQVVQSCCFAFPSCFCRSYFADLCPSCVLQCLLSFELFSCISYNNCINQVIVPPLSLQIGKGIHWISES